MATTAPPLEVSRVPQPGAHRKTMAWGIGIALLGVFFGLTGLVVFVNRVSLAGSFLGARVVFGMPWDQTDVNKVGMVALASFGAFGLAAVALVAGIIVALVAFGRSGHTS